MEPSQKRQKPILIAVLIFLFLATATSAGYLIYKYKSELNNQSKIKKTNTTKMSSIPLPYLNTFELPNAKVGTKYRGEVFATLTNTNENLVVSIEGLPDGLTLGQCTQEFNSKFIPIPNTQTKCTIEGIPSKEGVYHITISTSNKNNNSYNTVEQTIDLAITAP